MRIIPPNDSGQEWPLERVAPGGENGPLQAILALLETIGVLGTWRLEVSARQSPTNFRLVALK